MDTDCSYFKKDIQGFVHILLIKTRTHFLNVNEINIDNSLNRTMRKLDPYQNVTKGLVKIALVLHLL